MYMKSLKKTLSWTISCFGARRRDSADGILLEAISLQVNESSLTGEPIANKTVIESEFNLEATYPSNHVMRGTTVSDGHGIMQVLRRGDSTEFGKVAEKSSEKKRRTYPT